MTLGGTSNMTRTITSEPRSIVALQFHGFFSKRHTPACFEYVAFFLQKPSESTASRKHFTRLSRIPGIALSTSILNSFNLSAKVCCSSRSCSESFILNISAKLIVAMSCPVKCVFQFLFTVTSFSDVTEFKSVSCYKHPRVLVKEFFGYRDPWLRCP